MKEEKSIIDSVKKWRKTLNADNPIYKISNIFLKPYSYVSYKIKMVAQFLNTIPRRLGLRDARFELLKSYKGSYKGKRCFVVCTGPSLTIPDLEMLSNEYVFGMNSLCLIHDQTNWKPDFFVIQDDNVYKKVSQTLLETDNGICMVPISYKKAYNSPADWVYFHVSGAYHLYEIWEAKKPKFFSWFSNDAYATVYDGYSVTYAIFQIAMYMGFEEIYLLGCDCNYMGERQHFIEHGHMESKPEEVVDKMSCSFRKAKKEADKRGVKIINVTRGGMLEIYPRMQLEEVLRHNVKNKKEATK